MFFHQVSDFVTLDIAIDLFQMRIAGQDDKVVLQFIMHFRRAAFYRFAVVLHLVEGGRVTVAIDNLFAFFAARTGHDDFVGVDFDRTLSDDDITRKGNDVALHIQRLLIGFNMNRLIGITRFGLCRQAGGQ